KYVKNPVRSFRVEENDTNKIRYFDNVSVNCGGLNGFSDVVHAAYQLPPIKQVNLTWFSETDPFCIGSNEEFFEMLDKGVVEDDGNRTTNAEFVAQFLYDKLKRGDSMPSPYNLQDQFHTLHNTSVPYHVAWRATTKTLEKVNDNYDESYRLVPAFCDMVEKTNPGSLKNYTFGRHVYANFKKYYKGTKLHNLVCNAALCYNERHWKAHMDDLVKLSPATAAYMMRENPKQWSRAFYDQELLSRMIFSFRFQQLSHSIARYILTP
ncbi:hypothetical protein C5167_004681, partial [Papaver somniferum]